MFRHSTRIWGILTNLCFALIKTLDEKNNEMPTLYMRNADRK